MHWASIGEINDLPNALGEFRLSKNPSTANAAEAIGFGQTAGNDEIRSKMKGRTPRLVEEGFEIHLVDEDARANLGRDRTDLAHRRFIGKGTAWVVKIAKNHETRCRSDLALEFSQIQLESLFHGTFEAIYLGSNVIENRQKRVIGGALNQDFVARVDERCPRHEVCHRCAQGVDHAFLTHAGLCG